MSRKPTNEVEDWVHAMFGTPHHPRRSKMDVIKKIAQALWRRERERAKYCDAVLGSIRGQAVKPTMDPFEDHEGMWIGDASAALTALAENISDEMVEAAVKEFETVIVFTRQEAMRLALSAAIRAAANQTVEA